MSRIPLTCSKVREVPGGRGQSQAPGSGGSSSQSYRRNLKVMPSTPGTGGTKGEQFFEFMKSLGYQPPSKLRPEHLEYAFNDDKTATGKLVKMLMKKVKKEHALEPEEVQSYEKLKADGLALYGKDLEEAVDRRKAFEKHLSAEQEKKSAEKERLRQLIAQRKAEITEINSRSNVITAMITATQESKAKGQMITARLQRESKDIDIEIQVSQKRLNDKTESLKNVKKALLMNEPIHMKNAQSLVSINWQEIFQAEDCLTNDVRPLIQKHVADLIIRAEGYEDGNNTEQEADFLRQILVKHSSNFERLKHCIIYEQVRHAKLEIKLAGEKGAFVMLKPCLEQIRRAWMCGRDGNVFAQVQKEVEDSINALEELYEKEYKQAVEGVRGGMLEELDNQFATLINVKAHAKKRLHSFFLQVYHTLTPQKIRIDILRNVLKAEVNHYHNLVKKLQEHNERIYFSNMEAQFLGGDLNSSNLTPDGLAMQAFLSRQEMPLSLLRSVPGTLEALLKIHRTVSDSKSSSCRKEDIEYKQHLKGLSSQNRELTQLYRTLKDKYLTSNKERMLLQVLENIQKEIEGNVKSWEENKSRLVEHNIQEKKRLLAEMKKALA